MKIRREDLKASKEPVLGEKLISQAGATYRSWNEKLDIQDDDSILMMIAKIGLRFLLVFIMILLSPFLIIGLTIALAAVL